MRAVIQTVSSASVSADGEVVGEIADGLLVLVGITHTDTTQTAETMARKVHELRILDGEQSSAETGAPLLVVSQFTLYADTGKGRRPGWSVAAPAALAEPLIDVMVKTLVRRGATVATGRFRTHMLVASVNVGPRTVIIDL